MYDLARSFVASVERDPAALAIIDGDVRLTYGAWAGKIGAAANWLSANGVKRGDHLVTALQNSWEAATLHWACQFLGAIITPINWRASADELGYVLTDSEAVLGIVEQVSGDAGSEAGEATRVRVVDVSAIGLADLEDKPLPDLTTVRGRMQLAAPRDNGAAVFVDYAHTPDALATALRALRPHVMGRLVVVFGAGGDRDRGKRPLMGQAAADYADVAFVTDDNPRSEDPAAIRAEVMVGCPEATEVADRAEAILRGVDALGPGDALLVAGKGHETGQVVGDDVFPFDDAEQASVAVAALDGRVS